MVQPRWVQNRWSMRENANSWWNNSAKLKYTIIQGRQRKRKITRLGHLALNIVNLKSRCSRQRTAATHSRWFQTTRWRRRRQSRVGIKVTRDDHLNINRQFIRSIKKSNLLINWMMTGKELILYTKTQNWTNPKARRVSQRWMIGILSIKVSSQWYLTSAIRSVIQARFVWSIRKGQLRR